MENKWWFLKKQNKLSYDSIILLLGMCPKELKVGTERYLQTVFTTLVTPVGRWKEPSVCW